MKITPFLLSAFLVLFFGGLYASYFLADTTDVSVGDTSVDIKAVDFSGEKSSDIPLIDGSIGDCTSLDQKRQQTFEEAKIAFEEEGYEKGVEEFLKKRDEDFAKRFDLFAGTELRCDIKKGAEQQSLFELKGIETPIEFTQKQMLLWLSYDCALQDLEKDPKAYCTSEGTAESNMILNCDTRERAKIAQVRKNLLLAMKLALTQINEMSLPYPLHKRLECLNTHLVEQRRVMIDFVEIFAKVAQSLPNSAQSQ